MNEHDIPSGTVESHIRHGGESLQALWRVTSGTVEQEGVTAGTVEYEKYDIFEGIVLRNKENSRHRVDMASHSGHC